MAKRKQTITDKLRKLVQQQVRRMEKRGYIIDDETKAKIRSGKYQTLNALRKNKYDKLYNQSRAVDVETGEIFTAKEYRKLERKVSARKALKTRRFNITVKKNRQYIERKKEQLEREAVSQIEQEQDEPDVRETESYPDEEYAEEPTEYYSDEEYAEEPTEYYSDEEYAEEPTEYYSDEEWTEADERSYRQWQERRREQDIQERAQAKEIDAGEIIYDRVNDLIKAYPTPGSKFLDKALAKEITKYGRDAVLQGMANAPELVISAAQDILYYEENSDAIHTAFIRFFDTIMGTTIEDYAEELGDVMDEMTDYEEF